MGLNVITFYKFSPLMEENLLNFQKKIQDFGSSKGVRGLFILGTEGCNTTVCGAKEAIDNFKFFVESTLGISNINYKKSDCDFYPFHDFQVKIRKEIVTMDRPEIFPKDKENHLSPKQWHNVLSEEDPVIIDARNNYEVSIGKFKGARNPNIKMFTEFPDYVKSEDLPKDKKILLYCTGGIRCEKALIDMKEQGYDNVYQLDGGILSYLEEYPEEHFQGECFVFDYRVAVDQTLQPTKSFKLCPHCGDPGNKSIKCKQCFQEEVVCIKCLEASEYFYTCSKNCAHHSRLGHKTKRIHKDSYKKRTEFRQKDNDLCQKANEFRQNNS